MELMLQVTTNSVREIFCQDGEYYYKDSGEKVEVSKRLNFHTAIFSNSLPKTKHHDQEALDAIGQRMKLLREEARRKRDEALHNKK